MTSTWLERAAEMAVQFQRLDAFPELPGATALDEAAEADLMGVPAATLIELRQAMRKGVGDAAAELLDRDDVQGALAAIPPRFSLACIGDSLTADHQSWAGILAAALETVRPDVGLVRVARSGHTSLDAVRRLAGLLDLRADLFVVMIGTNDAIRYDLSPGAPLVSDDETRTNLERLADLASSRGARLVWITPPPVLPETVASFQVFRELGLGWLLADVMAKAALVRERPEHVIDLWEAFEGADLAELLVDDGLHFSLAGQAAVAAAVALQAFEPRS
jgi:acyl-CoA thioesterase-1